MASTVAEELPPTIPAIDQRVSPGATTIFIYEDATELFADVAGVDALPTALKPAPITTNSDVITIVRANLRLLFVLILFVLISIAYFSIQRYSRGFEHLF